MSVDYLAIARGVLERHRGGNQCDGSPFQNQPATTQTAPSQPEVVSLSLPPEADTQIDEVVYQTAVDILNRVGARHIMVGGVFTIAIWASRDSELVRWAARSLHGDRVRVWHLEDERIPARYRVRRGDYPDEFGTDWYTWKAGKLNALWEEFTGRSSNITPETVRHGERDLVPTKYEIDEINEISPPDTEAIAYGQGEGDGAKLDTQEYGDDP
jgi:hypothetical protein